MKLRYFIPAIMAVVGTLFSACSDDNDPTYLDEVRVSQSSIAFPAEGGSVTISLKAVADWTIGTSEKGGMPNWVTISPASGEAGSHEVTFTATAATDSREATLFIECAGVKQNLNLIQQTEKQELAVVPISNVIAGDDGTTFRVRGICVTNPNNEYGNWDIEDETGKVYVYGTCDKKGNKGKGTYPVSGKNDGWDFGVGDIITVEGPRKTYNGTIELVDVTVIAIEKSLIKVDSFDVAELPIEGGVATAAVTCKGNGISVEIPAEAQSWLSIAGIDTNKGTVAFRAMPNTGGDRSVTLTFKTTDDAGKEYTSQATLAQKGAILEVPVKDFLAAAVGDTQYRLTGVIMELYNTSKGLAGFYIQDYSGKTLIYQPSGFTGTEAKVGDIVTVVGKRGAYNNSPQMTSCLLEEVKSVTEISLAEFLTKPDDANTYYKVTGTIKSLKNNKGQDNDYGNLYLTDGTNEIYVYGTYSGWAAPKGDAQKYFIRDNGLEVGDELTMIGYKDTYNGLIEICGGTCFSFKKVQAAGAAGSKENPFTIAEAFAYIDAGGQDDVYVKGKVSKIQNEFTADNGYGTFWISEDGTYNNDLTKDFEAYRVYWFGDNKKWKEGDSQPAVGDEVIICGKLTKYTNKNTGAVTYETSQYKAYVYSLNGKTE